jgi:Ca-activated chloride channel homolog
MKIHLALFACLALVGFASAKEEVPTQGGMQAVVKKGEKPADLPLRHTEVLAEISGFVTRVKVIQTFANPYNDPMEAVYVFPLPQNAAVNDMQIRIGDRVIKGDIKKRDEARNIYKAARDAGKTAALLEQERPNIFSQSVANIMPGKDILVEITYDETLEYEKSGYEFVFPMVVGPRFIPGAPTDRTGGGWSPDTDKVPDASKITPPVLKPGERSGHDIQVTVKLNAGLPVKSFECPSHKVLLSPKLDDSGVIGGPCEIKLEPNDTIPNKDFVIRYKVAGAKPEMALLTHKGDLGGYFMLMFQPPEAPSAGEITPKEMVFVMDTSGSMSGEPIALSKKAVRYALQNLNSDDTFQIIRFSEAASPFAEEPLPATKENIRRGLSYINGLQGEGGTMMIEGIKAALDYPLRENRLRIVCFMTDGYIGNETEILNAVRKKLGDNTRLFSFGVGSSVNRYLLERMAEVGRGDVQYVLLNEKPDEAVNRFYARVRNPVLTNIRVDWAGLDVEDLYPARIRDLFAGQPIFVLGRYGNAGEAMIKIHGKTGGKDAGYELKVNLPAASSENGALAPLWARSRIRELEAEQYGGESADVEKAITDLALKYRLMSKYSSFVAVEEKIVNEDGKPRTVQVPVEIPEGVSYEGVFGGEAVGVLTAPTVSKVGFFGRAEKLYAVAPAMGMVRGAEVKDTDVAMSEPAEPLQPFTIELKTAGHQTIRIARNGEIWSGNTYVGRLFREQVRELWVLLSAAMKEKAATQAFSDKGSLTVRMLADNGSAEKETIIQLLDKDGPVSEAWKKVLEFVQGLSPHSFRNQAELAPNH